MGSGKGYIGRGGGLEKEVLGQTNGSLTQDCNVAWDSYDAFNKDVWESGYYPTCENCCKNYEGVL